MQFSHCDELSFHVIAGDYAHIQVWHLHLSEMRKEFRLRAHPAGRFNTQNENISPRNVNEYEIRTADALRRSSLDALFAN